MLPALATAVATAVAASLVSADARTAVISCGVVATVAVAAVAAEAARRGRALGVLRSQHAEQTAGLERRLQQQQAATVRLAREQLPRAVERLQEGEFADDVLLSLGAADEGLDPEFRAAHKEVLRSVVEAVQAEETLRDSAQRGVVNVARRVQAIVHRQATDLRAMEDRHGRQPEFFGDLLRLDHGTALIGRLADSIAVLGGARPGRQWSRPVPVYSVLRGAMSRVLDYQRVELHSVADVAVVGPAVEPLIHALAELLDNATRYSPPKARVHLTASEVHAGIAIEIEDGGVGLSEEARARAEQMLQEAQAGIDLNDLGEAPRLGLAVVGRLAQAYEFHVSLPPSAYGGVRAVLVVPRKLITTAPATGRAHGIGATSGLRPAPGEGPGEGLPQVAPPAPREEPEPQDDPRAPEAEPQAPAPAVSQAEAPAPEPQAPERTAPHAAAQDDEPPVRGPRPAGSSSMWDEEDDVPQVVERNANGLPQRRRRLPSPAAGRPGRATAAPAAAPPAASDPARGHADEPAPGLWMADLQSGLSGERPQRAPIRDNSDNSSDKGE